MERQGAGLAARFRRAVAAATAQKGEEEAARERARQAATIARDELFRDLVAFAQETGFVTATRDEVGVILRWRDAWVHFQPVGDADAVRVRFDGASEDEHRLYREALLGERWVWAWSRRGREDRLPLFDQGLLALLVKALGLPDPDTAPAEAELPSGAAPSARKKL